MRLLEPVARFGERRRLVRAGDEEDLEAGERCNDLVELCVRDGDLEVLVLAVVTA
jgi:hypothetical protein